MKEGKVFCARWLFCEALAQVAVAVVVVVVCVELVVEVVLKSDFCAGWCFPSVQYAGEEILGGGISGRILGWGRSGEVHRGDSPTIWTQTRKRVHNLAALLHHTHLTLRCLFNVCNWESTSAPESGSSPSYVAGRRLGGLAVRLGWACLLGARSLVCISGGIFREVCLRACVRVSQ